MSNNNGNDARSVDWKFVVTLIFILANAYLVSQGHQQLNSDILRVSSQSAQCRTEVAK